MSRKYNTRIYKENQKHSETGRKTEKARNRMNERPRLAKRSRSDLMSAILSVKSEDLAKNLGELSGGTFIGNAEVKVLNKPNSCFPLVHFFTSEL